MIICQCAAVSDRDLVRAIRKGADTLPELCRRTGASLCCGACRRDVVAILRAEQAAAAAPVSHILPPQLEGATAAA
ncbi:MAG TPA: (2Fe-2S)-binding protein [Terriglobales bacterium]|nr:(2Fe-2S)-binding protein [Terriglobales bacterium]